MSDELINRQLASKAADDVMDKRLLRALETQPRLEISADFAARVAGQLPAARPMDLAATHYGRNAVMIGLIVSLIALIAVSLHRGSHASFGLTESLLLTQVLVLAVWLSIRRFGVS